MPTDNKSIDNSSLSQKKFNKNNNKQIKKKKRKVEKYSSKFSFDKMSSNV